MRESVRAAASLSLFLLVFNSGMFAASAAVSDWMTNGPEGGDVAAIAVDPSSPETVYAGFYNGNGVFKTTDGGSTWVPFDVGLNESTVFALQIDPHAPTVLYAGTDRGVFKSTSAGASWASVGLSEQVRSLVVDPQESATVYAGTIFGGGIYKSTNAGSSWNPSNNGLSDLDVFALAISPSNPAIIYAGTAHGVFKSTDRGASWASAGLTASIDALALDPMNPAIAYAGNSLNGIFKTSDGGAHWAAANSGISSSCGPCVYTLAVDPAAPTTIYAGVFAGGVFKSTNRGGTWTGVNSGLGHTAVESIQIVPGNHTIVYAGTFGGGVFKSTNGGGSWAAKIHGMVATHVSSLAANPASASTAYAGTVSSGLFKTTDGGGHWTALATPLGNLPSQVWDMAIDTSTPATVYAVINGPPSVLKTTNAGAGWSGLSSGLSDTAFSSIAIAPSAPAVVYVGSFGGKVFRSNNGGTNWALAGGTLSPTMVLALAVSPQSPDVVYAGVVNSGLYKSVSGGDSWTRLNFPGVVFDVFALAVDPVNPSILYAGDYKSFDGGASWIPLGGLQGVRRLRIVPTQHTTLYATTSDGVFKSLDGGGSWSRVGETGPRDFYQLAISSDGKVLYGGSSGRNGGAYVFSTTSGTAACVRDADTACLLGGRFEVEVDWRTASSNGTAQVMSFGGQRTENDDSVFWWFFSATNFEMGVKVLNACVPSLGNKFWVFASGLTDQGWTVRVRDTRTGVTKTYENPTGQLSKTVADTGAFDCP